MRIIEELGPQPPCLRANHGVGFRVVGGIAFKHVHPDDALFQHLVRAGQRLRYHEPQKAAHPLRTHKLRARQQFLEVLTNRVGGGL